MNPFDLLFGFEGRAGRGQFWLALLIWAGVFLVAGLLAVIVTSSSEAWINVTLIFFVVIVILFVPVGMKRLHDRNKRGWWILLFLGYPTATFVLGQTFAGDESSAEGVPLPVLAAQYISLAVVLWAVVELGFIRGTIGSNPYGPDPVAPKPAKH